MQKISSALISVFDKDGLEPILEKLNAHKVKIYSTGGTEKFIKGLGYEVISIESITSYPSILGGRVKTLHPKIFGGILNRKNNFSDQQELETYKIPMIDLVIVDLYPFEKTVLSKAENDEIIEKIDIGGISLIRAAAKNYRDVTCISNKSDYDLFLKIITKNNCYISIEERKIFAAKAFNISSHYDTSIFNYLNTNSDLLKISYKKSKKLRYGENPHQSGTFFGDLNNIIDQIHGKELSYNNLLDIDSAVNLMLEFNDEKPSFGILKHNNACGFATRDTLKKAYIAALSSDPISAFGGVLISNSCIESDTAAEILSLIHI